MHKINFFHVRTLNLVFVLVILLLFIFKNLLDSDLGGVCFFYLILNITFFEFNAE